MPFLTVYEAVLLQDKNMNFRRKNESQENMNRSFNAKQHTSTNRLFNERQSKLVLESQVY